jgi:hypothetical protein
MTEDRASLEIALQISNATVFIPTHINAEPGKPFVVPLSE